MSSDITVPLVLSVVSLAGTILTTLVGAYITYYSDERKARREADKILLKYRDPLLMAATDLQARCFGICDLDLLDFKDFDREGEDLYKDTLYIYTAYVVGQWLSWTWILRRRAQFVALVSSSPPKWNPLSSDNQTHASSLMQKLEDVKGAFNSDFHNPLEHPLMLFKAEQQAIGEIMSCQDSSGEYYCMGYATFTQRWKNGSPENVDENGEHRASKIAHKDDKTGDNMAGINKISDASFRRHFKAIEDGIDEMYEHRHERDGDHTRSEDRPNQGSDGRLRRLQHILLDLINHLDSTGLMINKGESSPCHPAPDCKCSLSPCHCKRDCRSCNRRASTWMVRGAHAQKDCHCTECKKLNLPNRAFTSDAAFAERRSPEQHATAGHERDGDIV